MTYEQTLEYIHSVSWKGSIPGLERITELCHRLGDVQKGMRFIHVAGTNGKGSTCAMTASILRAAGYRVGLFTSPYVLDFCERIAIDGESISHEALCRAVEIVRPHAEAMSDAPTEFELITAIAFVCFAEAKCDVVVLECGLGGRLDSTNVIDSPELSVITNIALDHTSILGDTLDAIAREKAGIIKKAPVIAGAIPDEAAAEIDAVCRKRGVPICHAASEIVLTDIHPTRAGIAFSHAGEEYFVSLCGVYQVSNIRVVMAICRLLADAGWSIDANAIRRGLKAVRWRARFETIHAEPTVIFDGAHNPDGAVMAAATYAELYGADGKAILVSGVMADKDAHAIAAALSPICERAYVAEPDNPRAMDAAKWAQMLCDAGVDALPCDSVGDALRRAMDDARASGKIVLCAGSLYMYGDIIKEI